MTTFGCVQVKLVTHCCVCWCWCW